MNTHTYKHKFIDDLIERRRNDGSWAAYEDPNQMLLLQFQKMEDILVRELEIEHVDGDYLNRSSLSSNGKRLSTIPSYLLNRTQLDIFKVQAEQAMLGDKDYDVNFRKHSSRQSVTWPFPRESYGPFKQCASPNWSVLDKSFPRDS
jgi:hypothetical protein